MRRLRTALATTTVACLITACGGGANPEPAPPPKASTSSPTASASPTPPAMPAAARKKTKAGAIAFARHFMEVLNYSGGNGDTHPLRQTFNGLCNRCDGIADGIDRTYALGGSYTGGDWTPTRFKFYSIQNDVAVLDAYVTFAAQQWKQRAGATPQQFEESRNNLKAFNLRWTSEGWVVSALDPDA